MRKTLKIMICAILAMSICIISVGAVSLTTTCNATNCSRHNTDVSIGSGSMSSSDPTVTASTSTSGEAIDAYAQAGITMMNGETYSKWDNAVSSISVSATLPSYAPSPFSSGWSDHSSQAYCNGVNHDYYGNVCRNVLTASD